MEIKNEVSVINPAEYGLDVEKVKTIEEAFAPKIAEKEQLSIIYAEIIKSEITEDLCKRAGDTRKKLVKVRTGIADIHKTQKAFFLAAGRFCDAWKNKETQPIEQMEEKLSEVENYFVKLEAERIAKLKVERENLLSEYTSTPAVYSAHLLTDESFSELLNGLKLAKEAKEAAEKKAEEERKEAERIAENARIEKDKADKEEQERIKAENERLKKEADEKEAAHKLELDKQRKAKEDADAKVKQEQENARIAKDKADKEKADLEAKLKAKEDAEKKAKEDADAKKLADEKAAKEAERKAKNAPDKDKLIELAKSISEYQFPELKGEEANKILNDVKTLFAKVTVFINDKSASL